MTPQSVSEQTKPDGGPGEANQSVSGPAAVHELHGQEKAARRWVRPLFLFVLPGLLAVGFSIWIVVGSPYVKTENAYTHSDIAAVSAEISAPIVQVMITENTPVEAGRILFTLDEEPFRLTLLEMQASLERKKRDIDTLKASYREKLISLEVAKSDAAFAAREYQRQSELASSRVVSEARFDRARHERDVARQRVTGVGSDLERLLVSLAGDPELPVEIHPSVMEAQAKVARAELNLTRTKVRAPLSGVASNVPKTGDYIRAGFPAMSIVDTDEIWIEANFKETQLTFVEPGQRVIIRIDGFPGWEWGGSVESIASATGSQFSILPALNSSGNWVKVVQRIPVRIRIEPKGDEPLLRAGMSTHVSIDTGARRGAFTGKKPPRLLEDSTRVQP
jgi:membrane fusion protein, multidrug efflux system